MTQFEFFMTFYGLLLGLGTAELFGGFASILHERNPPRRSVENARQPFSGLHLLSRIPTPRAYVSHGS